MEYFTYTQEEIEYLSKKDKTLAKAMLQIGKIDRVCITNLYHALVNAMIGQQISTKAHATIWQRMLDMYGDFTVEKINSLSVEEIQKIGISMRKATYIKNLTTSIINGTLNLKELKTMSDEEVIATLVKINGVGVWTAEMIMLHSMQRKDILSYLDLAIIRGMRMLYRHRSIDKDLFMKYKKRYSPYGSVASIYLWAISAGALPSLMDPLVKKEKAK